MTNPTIPQTVRFPDLFDKPLVATFNREQASSDGGAVLLKAAERVYGLVKAFARCLVDKRAPEKVRHTLEDLVGQRVFGIACGHPDGNDADHLADDPIHKLLLGRDPVAGGRLASQPTISRFENDAGRSALYRMGRELAASVIERHRRRLGGRARRITIDLDPTDDRTHGAQQLTFFVVGLLKPRFSGRESTGLIDEVGAWSFCCVTTARALAVSLLLTELGLSSAIAVAFEKQDLGMVGQAVDQSDGARGVGEDGVPAFEG